MLAEFLTAFWPACVFAVALMLVIWWLALRVNNLGIIDIAWSASFAPIAIFYAAFTHGDPTRRWLMAGMAALWSLRLGGYVGWRVIKNHPHEDARYEQLRAIWKNKLALHSFWFFQIQAISVALLSILFLVVCVNDQPGISPVEIIGAAIWLIAIGGESLADWQLKQFKKNPKNKGRVCRLGLWNYSRHPNYFFEWLVWVGFYVFALGSPLGCAMIFCPALMLYFLIKVTGIPMTEKLAVKTKGDEYRDYQKTTSAFVPWFKRRAR